MVFIPGTGGGNDTPVDRQWLGRRRSERSTAAEAAQSAAAALPGQVQSAIDSGEVEPDDGKAPTTPLAFTVDSQTAYQSSEGATLVRVHLSWTEPVDYAGDTVTDGLQYLLRYRVVGGDWAVTSIEWGRNTTALYGLSTNTDYEAQVMAMDQAGNQSAWSAILAFTATVDTVPPSDPAPPTTVAGGPLRIQLTHELGKSTGGTFNLEADLDHLEVHVDTSPGFTPTPSTQVGKLTATGGMVAAGIAAVGSFDAADTALRYVKVVAVDRAGNRSGASAEATVTATLVAAAYIEDATITTAKIGDAQITTAKIADAQITSAKIGSAQIDNAHIASLSASKINAGTLSASYINGGDINGVTITGVTVSGGTVRTGPGLPRLEMSAATDDLRFYRTDGFYWKAYGSSEGLFFDDTERPNPVVFDDAGYHFPQRSSNFAPTALRSGMFTVDCSVTQSTKTVPLFSVEYLNDAKFTVDYNGRADSDGGYYHNGSAVLTASSHSHGAVPSGSRTTSGSSAAKAGVVNLTTWGPSSTTSAFPAASTGHSHDMPAHDHTIAHTHTITL